MEPRMKAPAEGLSAGSQWLLAMGLVVVGGLGSILVGIALYFGVAFGVLGALLMSATCLAAGWLLRSWWGLIASPVVYVVVAAVVWAMFIAGGGVFLTSEFGLFIVLPAVVMSAIGTAIGMYRAGQGGRSPHYGQPMA